MLGAVLNAPVAKQAVAKGLEHGLILNAPAADVIRLTPPLVITEAEIDKAVTALATVLDEVVKEEA